MNNTKSNPVVLTKAEVNKFWEKLVNSYEKYHYAYMMWQKSVIEYNEKYKCFGLPAIQVPPHIINYEGTLFKTHVEMELYSNEKNTVRYKLFLVRLLKSIVEKIEEEENIVRYEEVLKEKKRKVKKQAAKKREINLYDKRPVKKKATAKKTVKKKVAKK